MGTLDSEDGRGGCRPDGGGNGDSGLLSVPSGNNVTTTWPTGTTLTDTGMTTTSMPGSTSLPTTGADILGMAGAALGCLGLGLGAMAIVRRRGNGEVW